MKKIIDSFKYAFEGYKYTIKNEINFVIQSIFFILIIIFSILLKITKFECLIVLLVSASVFSLELINTALEFLVDLTTDEYNELAKKAKDISAAAVFVMAIFSFIIGVIIFLPYLIKIFS
mgnify:CR=1 FL=1